MLPRETGADADVEEGSRGEFRWLTEALHIGDQRIIPPGRHVGGQHARECPLRHPDGVLANRRPDIRAKLAETGVDAETAHAALAAFDGDQDQEDAEAAAALRFAERRRLGPWRRDPKVRAERRDRDIAAMARQGFPVRLSIRVIDGEGEG